MNEHGYGNIADTNEVVASNKSIKQGAESYVYHPTQCIRFVLLHHCTHHHRSHTRKDADGSDAELREQNGSKIKEKCIRFL